MIAIVCILAVFISGYIFVSFFRKAKMKSEISRTTAWDKATVEENISKNSVVVDLIHRMKFGEYFKDYPCQQAEAEKKEMMGLQMQWNSIWGVYAKAEKGEIFTRRLDCGELQAQLTKAQIFSIGLNIGTSLNRDKLFNSRPIGLPGQAIWREASVRELLFNRLGPRDWATIQNIWDMIGSLLPRVETLYTQFTGVEPQKLENDDIYVEAPFNGFPSVKGGFYPLEIPANTGGYPYWKTIDKRTGSKHFHGDTELAASLDINLVLRYISGIVHDLHFSGLIYDLRRLVNAPELSAALKEAYGERGYNAVHEYVRALAAPSIPNTIDMDWV